MTIYKSKIGFGIILPFLAVLMSVCILEIMHQDWFSLIFVLLIALFITHLIRTTRYTLSGTTLNVRSGFFVNTDIDVTKIKYITETNSAWSSPALSLDRLEIFYNSFDSIIISPSDKAQFITDLQAINPGITMS